MTYIENIFLCMVSPLLVAALCMGRRQLRFFLFCIAGMGVCLLSAYINTFLAAVCQADALAATAEIAPVVEEMMKLLPLVFYLLVFEPEGDKIKAAAITVALAFATFENVCYLIQNGADRFSFIFFRGFGTGAMHVLCGLIVGGGLAYAWRRTWLKIAGTCGLLGAAITLHAIYNLLIAYGGAADAAATCTCAATTTFGRSSTCATSGTKAARLLAKVQSAGIKTSVDIVSEQSDRFARIVRPALRYCDYCIINEVEGAMATGRKPDDLRGICDGLFELGVKERVVVHCPEVGVTMGRDGEFVRVGSLKLPDGWIKGSVGAGDAFCAGSLYALLKGMDPEALLRLASCSAAMNLAVFDAVSGAKSYAETMALDGKFARR